MHIYMESRKMVLYSQGINGDADIENRFMDKGGREEREAEAEMNGESSMETYTLTYVK